MVDDYALVKQVATNVEDPYVYSVLLTLAGSIAAGPEVLQGLSSICREFAEHWVTELEKQRKLQ